MATDTINKKTLGGGFVINKTSKNSIFTPEDFSDEQIMMRDAVKDFIDREVWPHKERFENKDYAFTKEIMEKAGELGFLGVSVPEEYGGLGMDFVSTMLVCDYISAATGSLSTAFGAHTGIGTLPITLYGTEEQKQKYVPNLASGKWFGSYCLTEPGAGSDANSGKTKAILSVDKKYYSITGQKMWISNAGFASIFIVFARIEDDKNITGFIVPADMDNGITLGDEEKKLGIHASSTRQVFFNNTKVPVENMLAGRGEGFKIAMNALNAGRIKLGVAVVDAQRRVLNGSVKYANERIQFKTPISQFGAIKEKFARMSSDLYACESGCYRAASDIKDHIDFLRSEGKTHQEAELKGLEEYAIECSMIKVFCSEAMQNSSDDGVQIFGGMGFSADTPMEAAWRDARIGRIYEGTNEINRMVSVGMLLKKAAKGHLDLMSPVMKIVEKIKLNQFDKITNNSKFVQEEFLVQKIKDIFLLLTGMAFQKYGSDLEKNQITLLALSDILIYSYFCESTLLRTKKNHDRNNENYSETHIQMTQLFIYSSLEKVKEKAKEIVLSIANEKEKIGLINSIEKMTRYNEYPNIVELKTSIADAIIKENKYNL
ncbi:MAG: acyl-CoA dehydrogenase family protein [Candidatus Marivariicella sp.]